jgi:hypothetical protein
MAIGPMTATGFWPGDTSRRRAAFVAATGLLAMAILAPFAQFGVLATLIVPADPAATTSNIAASIGLFVAAIAAFMVVAILDVAVAWGMYVLLRPVSRRAALVVAGLRVVYAAGFAYALLHLVDVAQLLAGAPAAALQAGQLQAQVASSVSAFRGGWDLALTVFGLHLLGLGSLLYRSADFPRLLGILVAVAGAGYLVDSLGRTLVPGYTLTVSTFTFIGEALLIVWLFRVAVRSARSATSPQVVADASSVASRVVAS